MALRRQIWQRTICAGLLTIVFLLTRAYATAAESRGLGIGPELNQDLQQAEVLESFSGSYALVVGIDAYHAGWPRLHQAVQDAELVRNALQARGFEVNLLQDPTADHLRRTLVDFFASRGRDPNARLLFWYAGHGATVDGEGYLVAADVPMEAHAEFHLKALSLRMFESILRLSRARHVLSVFDSCFAGTIFRTRGLGHTSQALQQKLRFPVRQFLTSGDAGQHVQDNGLFRSLFLEALREQSPADVNQDSFVTGQELGLYLSHEIATHTKAAQTPQFGRLLDVAFNRGDFVFPLPRPEDAAGEPPGRVGRCDAGTELAFWQAVQNTDRAEEYRLFLQQFPNCTFAELARFRLAELTQGAQKPTNVPLSGTTYVHPGPAIENRNETTPDTLFEGIWQGAGSKTSGGEFGSEPWVHMCENLRFDIAAKNGRLKGHIYSGGEAMVLAEGRHNGAGELHNVWARGALQMALYGTLSQGTWRLFSHKAPSGREEICRGRFVLRKLTRPQ